MGRIFVVTGNLSSGKSTFLKRAKSKNNLIHEADEIVKELLNKDSSIKKKYSFLPLDDRKKLARFLFKKPTLLRKWEKFIHKKVYHSIISKVGSKEVKFKNLFIGIPLYFESKYSLPFKHKVILVRSSDAQSFARANKLGLSFVKERLSRQAPFSKTFFKADIILFNYLTLSDFHRSSDLLLEVLEFI